MQELAGRVWPKAGDTRWLPGAFVSTALIVCGFCYFILTGSIATIWPMFGVANQLLATTALCVGTTVILRESARPAYAFVTLIPLAFVGVTTAVAGVKAIQTLYLPMALRPETMVTGRVNTAMTSVLLVCVAFILLGSVRAWRRILRERMASMPAGEARA